MTIATAHAEHDVHADRPDLDVILAGAPKALISLAH